MEGAMDVALVMCKEAAEVTVGGRQEAVEVAMRAQRLESEASGAPAGAGRMAAALYAVPHRTIQ